MFGRINMVIVMVKCPSCGGELSYSAKDKKVTCPYCKSVFNPKELKVTAKKASVRKDFTTVDGKSFTCSQCGAKLLTFDETAITFCSYCGSQAMIEEKFIKQAAPDFIIPFKKDKETCIDEYKKYIKSAYFAPDYMKDEMVIEKFRGIYMPYAIYKLGKNGKIKNNGEKYSHHSGNYTYYDKYDIDCDLDATYDGISFDISSKFYDRYSMSIPFDLRESEEFNHNYLLGFYADTYDVDSTVYDKEAKEMVAQDINNRLKSNSEFSKYGCPVPKVDLDILDRKIGYFPVYFLAIRDKDNKNVHYAVINGQTGKIAIDLPIDFKKYLKGSLILSLIIFIILNFFLLIPPNIVTWFSVIASFICLIIASKQKNKINARINLEDDLGLKSVKKEEEKDKDKKEKPKKAKVPFKVVLALIVPFVILMINPVEDLFFYIGAIFSLVLIVTSFKSLVEKQNILVTNKLPQLEKRGGDEQ